MSNLLGVSSNRLELPPVSDGGDVSPVGLVGGLVIGEPVLSSDIPIEETVEKEK